MTRTWKSVLDLGSAMIEGILLKYYFPLAMPALEDESKNANGKRRRNMYANELFFFGGINKHCGDRDDIIVSIPKISGLLEGAQRIGGLINRTVFLIGAQVLPNHIPFCLHLGGHL